VEFWIKTNVYNQTVMWGQWYNVYSPPAQGFVMGIAINDNGKAIFSCWQCDYTNPETSSAIGLNEWTYIAVTFGSEGAKIYINGVLEAYDTDPSIPSWSMSDYLYLPPWGISDGEMQIDELIVSNIIRTEQEIQNRYFIWTH
jgi:hypothetical protein